MTHNPESNLFMAKSLQERSGMRSDSAQRRHDNMIECTFCAKAEKPWAVHLPGRHEEPENS
jgi:hypothetical protein